MGRKVVCSFMLCLYKLALEGIEWELSYPLENYMEIKSNGYVKHNKFLDTNGFNFIRIFTNNITWQWKYKQDLIS